MNDVKAAVVTDLETKDIATRLVELGFTPDTPFTAGDFNVQDDSDGRGPYIRKWLSPQPCPFPEMIREPIVPPLPKEWLEARKAEQDAIAAAEKEREELSAAGKLIRDAQDQVNYVTRVAVAAIQTEQAKHAEQLAAAQDQIDAANGALAAAQDQIAELEEQVALAYAGIPTAD